MKHIPPGVIAISLIICLLTSATAQTTRRQSRRPATIQSVQQQPAVVIISDRPLVNYATRRNGDVFTITIYGAGQFRTIGGGQPFEQQQIPGTNDLVIALQLSPATNPQIEQAGTQLSIFFQSVSLPSSGIYTPPPAGTYSPQIPLGQTGQVFVGTPAPAPSPAPSIDLMREVDIENFIEPESSSSGQCDLKEPRKDYDDPQQELLVIDANTGKILEGSTHVSEKTRVKVVFVNKNPFKYDYSFQLIPKDLGNATILSFLNLIPGLPAIPGVFAGTIQSETKDDTKARAAAGGAAQRAKMPNQQRVANFTPQQNECDNFGKKLDTVIKNSDTIAKALTASKTILEDASQGYESFLKNTNDVFTKGGGSYERIQYANCLCEQGRTALPKLQAVLNFKPDEFAKSLKLDLFSANVTTLEAELPAGCEETDIYKKAIDSLKEDVGKYKTKLEEINKGFADGKKKFEGPTKLIKTALGSKSNAFAEAAYAPSLGDATSVAITVTRKNIRDEVPKDEMIAVSPPLEIGEPRIILTGGIGFSSINERKVVRDQSLIPDGNGGMTLGNRFGLENRSQFRPSGVVMLNGVLTRFKIFKPKDTSFAMSGGLVFSNRDDGLATEFIAGPSLGFANNRLFFTTGFHAARVEELSGGFKIGDPVPANLTDPIPVQKNWLNGIIMSLTFRIQP